MRCIEIVRHDFSKPYLSSLLVLRTGMRTGSIYRFGNRFSPLNPNKPDPTIKPGTGISGSLDRVLEPEPQGTGSRNRALESESEGTGSRDLIQEPLCNQWKN